jgi:hypothetical protein
MFLVTALVPSDTACLAREQEPHSGLDLPGGDGGPLVVVGKAGGLGGDPLEDVGDEGVHDAHVLGGDAGVAVHLLQDLVDIDGIGLIPLLFLTFFLSPLVMAFWALTDFWAAFPKILGGMLMHWEQRVDLCQ